MISTKKNTEIMKKLSSVSQKLNRESWVLLASTGIDSIQQWFIFDSIKQNPGVAMKELLKENDFTKQNLSSLVDKLVKKGLVESHIFEADKRTIRLGLTKRGLELYEMIKPMVNEQLEGILSEFKSEELIFFEEFLEKLHKILNEDKDIVKEYLKDIDKYPLLEEKQEVKLLWQCKNGHEEAKRTLYHANLRLVVSIVKNYMNKGYSFMELIQEGNIALLKAIEFYANNADEPKNGIKLTLSPYILEFVHSHIREFLKISNKYDQRIELPRHLQEKGKKYGYIQTDKNQKS